MPFFNPNGHDWANNYNFDGWGTCLIVFAILYTFFLLGCSGLLWQWRNHAVIRMRKPGLAISAVLVLHVYVLIILLVYPWNGRFPCAAEFWIMSIYLPIGIGLFQASNQVLLLISRGQQVMLTQDTYRPLPSGKNRREYCWSAFMIWCRSAKQQDIFEGFLAAGMVLQFIVSLFIFIISRRFKSYGIVSQPTTPELCRRGWEWAPSIIWQAVWNYAAGPYLLYKIRVIRDIYNWRLQTTIAIIAGLPGTPLWLAAVYSDKLDAVNKYWVPAMWFAPGLITIQLIALLGPLGQVFKSKKLKKETDQALQEFDMKKSKGLAAPNASLSTTSVTEISIKTGTSTRYSVETLENCISTQTPDLDPFRLFCANRCLCVENVSFLEKVTNFKREWDRIFGVPGQDFENARLIMYRVAINIYLILINDHTAEFPINIEGHIKNQLNSLFHTVAIGIAARVPSIPQSTVAVATPWDEPADPFTNPGNDHPLRPLTRHSLDKGSSTDLITEINSALDGEGPFTAVPAAFDSACFDRAAASIKHMLWQQPWQEYMRSKRGSAVSAVSSA